MRTIFLIVFILGFAPYNLCSTTWDEPWRKDIIIEAEHFVFGTIIEATDSAIAVAVLKDFDNLISGEIIIDGYFMLDLCSMSGKEPLHFNYIKNEQAYFLLKKGENGNYQVSTPTSGVDRIVDSQFSESVDNFKR